MLYTEIPIYCTLKNTNACTNYICQKTTTQLHILYSIWELGKTVPSHSSIGLLTGFSLRSARPRRLFTGPHWHIICCTHDQVYSWLKLSVGLSICVFRSIHVGSRRHHPDHPLPDRYLLDSGGSVDQRVYADLRAVLGQVLHHRCDGAGGGRAWRSPSGCHHLPGLFSQGLSV